MIPELSVATALLAALTLLFAGVIRGISGFGLLLVSTPLLILLLPAKLVIAALIVPTIPTDLTILYQDGVNLQLYRERWPVLSLAILGTAMGVVGLRLVSMAILSLLVACYIFGYLLLSLYEETVHRFANRPSMGMVSGALGGLLGGATGMAGPPIVTYLHAQELPRATFTSLLALFFTTITLVRLPTMIATELFGPAELLLGLGFVVPTVVGVYLGTLIRPYLPEQLFETFVDVLLLIVAVRLAMSGLGVSVF